MQAGFSRVDITPELGAPIEGNFRADNLSQGVYQRIYSHSACFSKGNNYCTLTSLEVCGISGRQVREIRERVSRHTPLNPDSILIAATHTHSGPVTGILPSGNADRQFPERLVNQVSDSIIDAYHQMEPVEVYFGKGEDHNLSHNRRLWTKDGKLRMNWEKIDPALLKGEAGPIDPEILVLSCRDLRGKVKGILINFTLHPAILAGDNNLISGDFVGFTWRELAGRYYEDKPEIIFFNGAEGNINHIDPYSPDRKRGFEEAGRIGRLLAEDVSRIMAQSKKIEAGRLNFLRQEIALKRRKISQDKIHWAKDILAGWDGKPLSLVDGFPDEAYAQATLTLASLQEEPVRTEVRIIQIGLVKLTTLPGEFFVEYGLKIKQMAGRTKTMVIGLANDYIGYVPTRRAFEEGGYEVTLGYQSYLDENTGEVILKEMEKLFSELKEKNKKT